MSKKQVKKLFIEELENKRVPVSAQAYLHANYHAAFQPQITTMALGEESSGPGPIFTTLALGEE